MREQTGAQAGHKGGGWVEGGELKKGVVVKTSPKKEKPEQEKSTSRGHLSPPTHSAEQDIDRLLHTQLTV